jgi:tetratricopeptide (TPR) repeat protein
MRARLLLVLGVTVALTLRPSTADAQLETFVQALRELAEAAGQPETTRSNDIHIAATRMGTALAEWDRNISALEAQAQREIPGASNQRAYQLRVQLGVTYRTRGRLADALREFDAAVALQPSASDVQVLRALTLEAMGWTEEAGKAFRTAWNFDSRNPIKAYYVAMRPGAGSTSDRDRARMLLTETYRRFGTDTAQPSVSPFVALGALTDNLSRKPAVADHATAAGFALLKEEKYSDGITAILASDRSPAKTSDDSPLDHFARGQRDEAQNRVADARREYQDALAGTVAGRSVLLVGIGRLAQVEGDLDGAIEAYTRAARFNPNDPNIRKELASAYAAGGRADDAFCELIAALLIDPRDARAHAGIGQLYLDAERDAEAVTAFSRALELKPDGYETRYALATAFTRLGKTAEAAREFEQFERVRREKLEERRRGQSREAQPDEREEDALRTRASNQGSDR